jgi:hypothetical protein
MTSAQNEMQYAFQVNLLGEDPSKIFFGICCDVCKLRPRTLCVPKDKGRGGRGGFCCVSGVDEMFSEKLGMWTPFDSSEFSEIAEECTGNPLELNEHLIYKQGRDLCVDCAKNAGVLDNAIENPLRASLELYDNKNPEHVEWMKSTFGRYATMFEDTPMESTFERKAPILEDTPVKRQRLH